MNDFLKLSHSTVMLKVWVLAQFQIDGDPFHARFKKQDDEILATTYKRAVDMYFEAQLAHSQGIDIRQFGV